MCNIGLVGYRKDLHVTALQNEIKAKGKNAYIIDFTGLSKSNYLTLHPALHYDDLLSVKDVPFSDLDIIYIRNFASSNVSLNDLSTYASQSILSTLLLNLQFSLINITGKKIPVINSLGASSFHRLKTAQHHLLSKHNITVPDTFVTNNMLEAKKFVAKYKGKVVVKPQAGGAEVMMAGEFFFNENKQIIKSRPFIFQQFVSGRSIRVYLLGGEIISAGEIFFDRNYIDWRERVTDTKHFNVPGDLAEELSKAAKLLDLAYCAIDVEYDNASKKYYLLDFNPSGLYVGWCNLLNINIPALIADYLIKVVKNKGQIWY